MNLALIAIAVGRLLPTRLGASCRPAPGLYDPGVDPAIHAAPPQRRAPVAPDRRKGLRNNAL